MSNASVSPVLRIPRQAGFTETPLDWGRVAPDVVFALMTIDRIQNFNGLSRSYWEFCRRFCPARLVLFEVYCILTRSGGIHAVLVVHRMKDFSRCASLHAVASARDSSSTALTKQAPESHGDFSRTAGPPHDGKLLSGRRTWGDCHGLLASRSEFGPSSEKCSDSR
eukprot:COSAG02_NODE_181_length_30783_cov_53.060520_7_plen_166_part_00